MIHNILLDTEKYLDSEEIPDGLVVFNNLDIDKLSEQFIGVIEKKVKDCEVSNEKWLDNKEIAEKKIRYVIYNILLDIEKHLNAKAEPEGLALFNNLDINKLCKHFIEFIEKKLGIIKYLM